MGRVTNLTFDPPLHCLRQNITSYKSKQIAKYTLAEISYLKKGVHKVSFLEIATLQLVNYYSKQLSKWPLPAYLA